MQAPFRYAFSLTLLAAPLSAQSPALEEWSPVSLALQTPAVAMPGYVRFNLPRTDLQVTLAGVTLAVPVAQGGWVGFAGTPTNAVVLGDLVVVPAEVGAVSAALQKRGFEVTAIHNHLLGERPPLAYVHLAGQGPAMALAAVLDTALRLTAISRPVSTSPSPPASVDSLTVFGPLGQSGRIRGSVAQTAPVLVLEAITWRGQALPPALVAASPINLQAVGPTRLVGSGDFAVTESHVPPLLRTLSRAGITVTAVHSHLVGESPHLTYVHFWADGTPATVLAGLRAAIDTIRAGT